MERKIRMVDNDVYLPVLKELVQEGNSVPLLVSGSSMAPFLVHLRDTIIISKPEDTLKKGDMVFYNRASGQYVMHRIHHIDRQGNLYIVGDAQTEIEGPIHPNQVFGVIKKVIRKGKILQKGDLWWFFFEKVWIHCIPIRNLVIKLYSKMLKN